ncbi:MAG: sporulation integral membrane protein YlbJ, partial [Bacillota bacterium]
LTLLLLSALLISYPSFIFSAAKKGLDTWWQFVLPGLFPFFILVELLAQFGVIDFLGILLEPIMKPLFNIPGRGAFVLTAGFTSGAPIGGILTSQLYQEQHLSRGEAARLVSFTNNASPLFILGSISVGLLGQPQFGKILALSHYFANLLIGILLGLSSSKKRLRTTGSNLTQLLVQAFTNMHHSYLLRNKSLGVILREAAKSSMEKMLIIGGFIIMFSVLIEILSILGILKILAGFLGLFLIPIGLDPSLMLPLSSGIFEMTIGIKMIAESGAPILQQLLCISIILGWAGLSVHAQVAAFLSGHNISLIPYYFARILQGTIAASFAYILLGKGVFVLGEGKIPLITLISLSKIILVCKIVFVMMALFFILDFLKSTLKR